MWRPGYAPVKPRPRFPSMSNVHFAMNTNPGGGFKFVPPVHFGLERPDFSTCASFQLPLSQVIPRPNNLIPTDTPSQYISLLDDNQNNRRPSKPKMMRIGGSPKPSRSSNGSSQAESSTLPSLHGHLTTRKMTSCIDGVNELGTYYKNFWNATRTSGNQFETTLSETDMAKVNQDLRDQVDELSSQLMHLEISVANQRSTIENVSKEKAELERSKNSLARQKDSISELYSQACQLLEEELKEGDKKLMDKVDKYCALALELRGCVQKLTKAAVRAWDSGEGYLTQTETDLLDDEELDWKKIRHIERKYILYIQKLQLVTLAGDLSKTEKELKVSKATCGSLQRKVATLVREFETWKKNPKIKDHGEKELEERAEVYLDGLITYFQTLNEATAKRDIPTEHDKIEISINKSRGEGEGHNKPSSSGDHGSTNQSKRPKKGKKKSVK